MTSQETSAHLQFLWSASHTVLSAVPSLSAFYLSRFDQIAVERNLNLAGAIKRVYCNYCGTIFVPGINSQVSIEKVRRRHNKRRKVNTQFDSTTSTALESVKTGSSPAPLKETVSINKTTPSNTAHRIYHATLNHNTNNANNPRSRNYVSYFCRICKTETRIHGSARHDLKQTKVEDEPDKRQTEITANISSKRSTLVQRNIAHGTKIKRKKQKLDLQRLLAKDEKKEGGRGSDGDRGASLSLTDFLSSL
ncbi:6686_t:CDS:1 [Paraglomus brasilianum]|uniref:6686_t:CDS:1 n=1 Tax=Paraglomus brasilianum TaxID=144538 RepID=A0A9N9FJS9_9GLOM|nr:6686_t:CDS:1 [Paraglomus brasilianum]